MNDFRFKDSKVGRASRLSCERVSASRRKTASASDGFADGGQGGRLPCFQQ
jgi:hypothetical protein